MRPAERLATDAEVHAGVLMSRVATRLADAGSSTARLDAELLVGHAFGRDRSWLHAHPDAPLDPLSRDELEGWVERRGRGEPVAYIRGYKEWFGLRVATDARALIPRPETELLAEAAIAEIAARLVRDDRAVLVRDVATGGGAVAVALALRFRAAIALGRVRLVASDLSADALELAAENLAAHGASCLVRLASAISSTTSTGRETPPRRSTCSLPTCRTSPAPRSGGKLAVSRSEPRLALDGGPDGLDVVRRLIVQLPGAPSPGGVALLEIGAGQASAVGAWPRRCQCRTWRPPCFPTSRGWSGSCASRG